MADLDHPHIVRITDDGEKTVSYLAMEYGSFTGLDLKRYIKGHYLSFKRKESGSDHGGRILLAMRQRTRGIGARFETTQISS